MPPRRSRLRLRVFWLTFALYFATVAARKGVSVAKSSLLAGGVVRDSHALAAVDTAFLATYTVGSFVSAVVADRVGDRQLLALAAGGSALSGLAGAYLTPDANGVLQLSLFWGGVGLFQGFLFPLCFKVLSQWFSDGALASVAGAWSVSGYAGGAAGNVLLSSYLRHHGWRSCLSVPAWLVLVAAAATWLLVPEAPLRNGAERSAAAGGGASSPSKRLRGGASGTSMAGRLLATMRLPYVSQVASAYFLFKLVRYSLLFWLPFFLHRLAGLDTSHASKVAAFFEWGSVLGCAASGVIVDKLARGRRFVVVMPMLALTAAALGALAVWAAAAEGQIAADGALGRLGAMLGAPWASWLLLLTLGFNMAGPDTMLCGTIPRDLARGGDVAAVVGVVDGIGAIGSVLQGVVTSGVAHAYGWSVLYALLGALICGALALLLPAMAAEEVHAHKVKAKSSSGNLVNVESSESSMPGARAVAIAV